MMIECDLFQALKFCVGICSIKNGGSWEGVCVNVICHCSPLTRLCDLL